MGRLRIKLLGGYTVLDDRTGEVALPARKAQALLAYTFRCARKAETVGRSQ